MGKLISIVSSSRKKSEKVALDVQKILKSNNQKVALIQIANGTAPEFTKSPYISSLYDINVRYTHIKSIARKLKTNNYVIVIGYIAETKIREIEKLNTLQEKIQFNKWLNNIELNTYSLIPADATYLVVDQTQDSVQKFKEIFNDEYTLIQNKDSANKIAGDIANIKIYTKNITSQSLYDAICLMSTGNRVDFSFVNSPIKDSGLRELLSANKLIANKLNGSNPYIEGITRPLGQPIIIHNSSKIYPQHTKGMLDLFDALIDRYQPPNDECKQIISNPKNEIELSNLIADNYGMTNSAGLSYKERMRIIENWAMQPNKVILQNAFNVEISATLCLYDLLILNRYVRPTLSWLPLSPINGYVDCTAPTSIESIVQDTFDKSTVLSATATFSQERYLLLGHKIELKLLFNWNDLELLHTNSNIAGSELLKSLIEKISKFFDEKFPIYMETITNKK